MIKLGTADIAALRLSTGEVTRAYLGSSLVFDATPAVKTHTITATIDPTGGGTVTGAGQYQEGASVTLTATPADGYQFMGWQEDGQTVSTDNPYTFTAAGDRALASVFAVASRLPAGYTELQYIHFDGTKTSFSLLQSVVCNTDKLIFQFKPDTVTYSYGGGMLYYNSAYTYSYVINVSAYKSGIVYTLNDNTYKTTLNTTVENTMFDFSFDFLNETYTANGLSMTGYKNARVIGSANRVIGKPYNTTSTTNPGLINSAIGNFYKLEHYRNDELIEEYVPCLSPDNVAGIFEVVSQTFIINTCNNATTITAGPAV